MVSKISRFTFARPPTSSQDTFGIFGAPMLSEYEARASPNAISKSALVNWIPAEMTSSALISERVVRGLPLWLCG